MIIYQGIFLGLTLLITFLSILLFETEVGLPLEWSFKNLALILVAINAIILLITAVKEVKLKTRSFSNAVVMGLITGLMFCTVQSMLTVGYANLYNGIFSSSKKVPLIGKIIKKERSINSSKNGEGYHYTTSIRTQERTVKINVTGKQWNKLELYKQYNTGMHQGALGFYYKKNF